MKKFLSKMPVMIVFLSLAVVGLVFYIVMLARPISYGMTYSYTQTVETEQDATESGLPIGSEVSMHLKFKSDKRAEVTMTLGENSITTEIWIVRMGNKVAMLDAVSEMTEEQYNQEVENFKADKTLFENSAAEINAFRIKFDTEDSIMSDMKCNGAVVFAVVWGVVELALIAFGALSLVFFLKDRKDETVQASDTPVAE